MNPGSEFGVRNAEYGGVAGPDAEMAGWQVDPLAVWHGRAGLGLGLLRGMWFRGTDSTDSMDSDLLAPRGFAERTWFPRLLPWLLIGGARVWTRAMAGRGRQGCLPHAVSRNEPNLTEVSLEEMDL